MTWFYAQNGQQHGPITAEEIITKVKSGELPSSTLVWKEGMAEWTPFASVAELQTPPASSGIGVPSAPSQDTSPTPGPASPQTTTPASVQTTSPQPAPGAASALPPGETIPNYLWQSIATTVLCCVPFGVVSIIFAAKVNGLIAAGDLTAARDASKKAKFWASLSFGIGLVVIIISIVANVISFSAAGGGTFTPPAPPAP